MSEQEFKKARKLAANQATSYRKLLRLSSTIANGRRSWFHLGHAGDIYLCNQHKGRKATGHVRLSRAEFEKFVRFYETAQKCRRGSR